MNTLRYTLVVVLVVTLAAMAGAQATYTSTASGAWSTMTWSPAGTPGANDNVVIADGHTVTINQNVSIANLTVGGGTSGTLTFDATTARVVTVSGNITVAAGGSFVVFQAATPTGDVTATSATVTNVSSTAGITAGWSITGAGIASGSFVTAFDASTITLSLPATVTGTAVPFVISPLLTDSLVIGGDLTNNGTFDMSLGGSATVCNVLFNKAGDQTISGTGAMTRFRIIHLSKGAVANKVTATTNVTTASTSPVFVAGTWEQAAGRLTNTSGTINIGTGATAALNIIGSGSAKIANSLNVYGSLLVNTSDSVIVGSGTHKIDHTYVVGSSATYTSGTVVVYGKFQNSSQCATTINGAKIIVDPKGATASDYAFRYTTGGGTSPFTFTSGTVTILNPNGAAGAQPELAMSSSIAANISGTATFVLGQGNKTLTSPLGFRININTTNRLNNLTIDADTVRLTLATNVNANGKITVTGSGPLLRSGVFFWKAPHYVFNGSVAQETGSIMPDTVKSVTINNAAGVTASDTLTILDTLFLVSGTLTGTYTAGTTITGGTAAEDIGTGAPNDYFLARNYPNPFNPSTSFTYRIANEAFVSVKVYDALGREVATLVNEVKQAGTHPVTWNAAGVGSGVYYYKIQAGSFKATRSMILVK